MAEIAGTTTTYDIAAAGGNREDLEDVIWDLFPADTWALSNLDRTKVSATYHEWLVDALAGATANRQLEGDDATYATVVAATRMGNYTQISRKAFLISRTQERISKAGRKSEVARQAMKAMKELKRDMEQALVGNQAGSAGGQATARSAAGMESWIATTDHGGNGVRSTSTSSASTVGFTGSTLPVAPTDGTTTGALTEAKLREAIQLAWEDGGDPTIILAGPAAKNAINGFAGIATKYNEVGRSPSKNAIVTSADVFVTDFGNHTVVLHRYLRSSVVLAIDPDYWSVGMLDAPFMETLAKTGDGEKRQLITEFTLVARNPNASGKVVAVA